MKRRALATPDSSTKAKRPIPLSEQFNSSRLSLNKEVGIDTDDIVISTGYTNVNLSNVSFSGHKINEKFNVFSINNVGSKEVKHCGTSKASSDGFDYYVAMVDNKTGLASEFRPVSLAQCEAIFRPRELGFTIEKEQEKFNDEQNINNYEEMATRRRNLTAEFGSIKQNKFLESASRRRVDPNTLSTLGETTPVSLIKNEIDENKTPTISLLQKAESVVLPFPNMEAKNKSNVYTFEQFLPKTETWSSGLSQLDAEALQFFQQYPNSESFIEIGISKFIANLMNDVLSMPNASKVAIVALKTIFMSKLLSDVFILNRRTVDGEVIMNLEFPPLITSVVCEEFLSLDNKNRYQLLDKAKLQAHFLCLLLLFDAPDYSLPVSCVTQFSINELTAIRLLKGMGCEINASTVAEVEKYNSLRMARLIGPPREKNSRRRSGR